jgi:hypothetical protein
MLPIAKSLWSDDTGGMPELLISFRRPTSLPSEDLSSWLASQRRAFALLAGRLAAEPATSDAAGAGSSLLQVSLPAGTGRTADARITELLTDMRMLGLNPQIVAPEHGALTANRESADSVCGDSPDGAYGSTRPRRIA